MSNRKNVTSLPTVRGSANTQITVAGDGRPPLPENWVRRIFAVLSAAFGRQFADQWAGVDPDEMIGLWARKLAGYIDQPDAIRKALDDATNQTFPPNVGEFLAMCQRHYKQCGPALLTTDSKEQETTRPDIIAEMKKVLEGKSA